MDVNSETNFTDESGIEFLANIDISKDSSSFYRFSNNVLIEYGTTIDGAGTGTYCWVKYSLNEFLSLMYAVNREAKLQYIMGFLTTDPAFYGLGSQTLPLPPPAQGSYTVGKQILASRISFKQFHIGKDVYNYPGNEYPAGS